MSWIRKILGFEIKGEDTQFAKRLALFHAYRRCFMDAAGELTDDGKLVLADLIDKAGLVQGQINLVDGNISTNHLLVREGKREIINGMLRRLYQRPMKKEKQSYETEEMEQLNNYIHVLERELSTL